MSTDDVDVFVVPCEPELFERTVRTPVDPNDHPDAPDALDGLDDVRLWGVPAGANNRRYFERMEAGDLLLFYHEGTYLGTGRVGTTFEDGGWASGAFWEDEPLALVFTVEAFTPVSVPKRAVNRIFDYAEGYTPQGLMRVADERVINRPSAIERALEKYSDRSVSAE